MSFYMQSLLCWTAFALTAAIYSPSEPRSPFETEADFLEFKKERRLMWCDMSPQLTENDDWIRDVPTCSFGGYYPNGPIMEL